VAYQPLNLGEAKHSGYLAVIMSYSLEKAGLHQLLINLVNITVTVTVISIFIAILIGRKLAQPIKTLARETELVEAPHYTTSLKKTRQDEIGILQEQFLVMLNRLRKTEAEKEQTRQTLIQTEKMASIGTIASGVAHEINNPLAGLKQSISRIINDPGNVNQTKKYGSMILEALLHIENVVRGLLDFSKKRELNFKNIDLKRVLEDSVNMLQYEFKRKHIRLQKQFSKQPALVSGNIYYLKQVFINLLLNAIQAIPKSGDVIVRTLVNGNDIIVEVEDTGIGIEASKLDKIFNPFFTTKGEEEGTGLGLPICYSIIHDHGGDITVTSQVGVGTKFAVTLPHV
jgi:signal transduction histidine kinase